MYAEEKQNICLLCLSVMVYLWCPGVRVMKLQNVFDNIYLNGKPCYILWQVYVKINSFWLLSLATAHLEFHSSENAINCNCKYKCKKTKNKFSLEKQQCLIIMNDSFFIAWKYRWQWIITYVCLRERRTYIGKCAQVHNLSIVSTYRIKRFVSIKFWIYCCMHFLLNT